MQICTAMPHPMERKTTRCEERVANAYTQMLINCSDSTLAADCKLLIDSKRAGRQKNFTRSNT